MRTRTRTRTRSFLDRVQDPALHDLGEDALPRGTAHTQIPYTGAHKNLVIGIPPEHELYRVRTRPELYPEWLVEAVHTHRAALVERVNMLQSAYDWDCTACRSAVITPEITDPCPRCHTQRVYS